MYRIRKIEILSVQMMLNRYYKPQNRNLMPKLMNFHARENKIDHFPKAIWLHFIIDLWIVPYDAKIS